MKEARVRRMDAMDERQYMIDEKYEVYEKQGVPYGALSYHYHNFYEILYVLEGEFSSLIEDRTYHLKKGDFLLVDRNKMHKYHYVEKRRESSKRIILWITQAMLLSLSGSEMDLEACFQKQGSCAWHFPVYYEEMLRGYLSKLALSERMDINQPGAKSVLDKGYLTLFFVYLNELCVRKEYLYGKENSMDHPMVFTVSSYIEDHILQTIPVEELAAQVHMSKYHFLRKFKELTGMTVHSYIISKRMMKACGAIRDGASITQAYQNAGFHDYSSFFRNFKKTLGVSPGKYKDYYC